MEWKNKIDQFQADPPPLAWEAIENELRLDEQAVYNYAGIPPTESWNEIAAKLAPLATQKPTASQRFWPVLRYAAMIAFIALIGTTILNKPFRNIMIETFQGPGMKASLSDTPHAIKNDTSANKKHHTQLP